MCGSDLGTRQGCLVPHSAALTTVPSHHLFLNWWAEGQGQICACSCWGCRCSLGLVSDIAMMVSSLQRHLEEWEGTRWLSMIIMAGLQTTMSCWTAFRRCSSTLHQQTQQLWHCGRDLFTWVFFLYSPRVVPHRVIRVCLWWSPVILV